MAEPTYCEDCDYVERESRKKQPYGWLCMRVKRLDGHGYVVRDTWTNGEPYARCKDVNLGACPLFKPKATPQTSMEV